MIPIETIEVGNLQTVSPGGTEQDVATKLGDFQARCNCLVPPLLWHIYIVTEQLTIWSFSIAIGHGSY